MDVERNGEVLIVRADVRTRRADRGNPEGKYQLRMTARSIAAYDVSQRVKTYDADMDLMHPNRSKMVQVALEVLPFPKTATLRAIDLGIGTGYFTERFLNNFPNSSVIGIDGAQAMIELAKARLKSMMSRVEFFIGDFRNLQNSLRAATRSMSYFLRMRFTTLIAPIRRRCSNRWFRSLRPAAGL